MIVKKNEAQSVTELLKELFKTHGFESEVYDDWIIPEGGDYGMKGYWYPEATESTGQLSIEVFINSEMIMVESFSGMGENAEERLKNAFASFVHHSSAAFLQAVWGAESKEVKTEQWDIGTEKYMAYIGHQGILNYDTSKELEIPARYEEKIKELISSEPLDKEFHWFNVLYANMNGLDNYAEILKDNIKWNAGEELLKSLGWVRSNNYYVARQFIILKKV